MDNSLSAEYVVVEPKMERMHFPLSLGEVGTRWNQVFGINSGAGNGKNETISHQDILGLVKIIADYWRELWQDKEMMRPYWKDENPAKERVEWTKVAECLRLGEGDLNSIDHVTSFFSEKISEQIKTDKLDNQRADRVRGRLSETVVWLKDFQKNPRPLPKWQKDNQEGLPALKYPEY